MKRNLSVGATFLAVLVVLGVGSHVLTKKAVVQAAGGTQAPRFEVDPMWPKPLPNHWLMGNTIGVSVDSKDQSGSFIARARSKRWKTTALPIPRAQSGNEARWNRNAARPRRRCWNSMKTAICWQAGAAKTATATFGRIPITASPSTTKATCGSAATAADDRFLARGAVAEQRAGAGASERRRRWRGPGPPLYHDSMIMKFTQDGKFLMQIGRPEQSKGSNDTENLGLPAKIFVDPKTNEVYVADGYGNKRVIVFDADTGKFKRYWGAYGHKPDDTNLGTVQSGCAAGPAVPQSGALRRALQRRPALCLRPRQRPHPGLQTRRDVRQGEGPLQEHAGRRLGVGHRVLEGSAAEIHLSGRRRQREGPHPGSRHRWKC